MELIACGFDAHGQLDYDRAVSRNFNDSPQFKSVICSHSIEIVFVGWSQTVLNIDGKLHCIGHKGSEPIQGERSGHVVAFGDHEGILGIFFDGFLQPIASSSWPLQLEDPVRGPRIAHIAITAAGRVAVVIWVTPAASTFHIMEFASYNAASPAFLSWIREPTSDEHRPLHFQTGGRCKQLVANYCSFTVLTEQGDVLTWGDARHPNLCGRPSGENESPIHKPGLVPALGGLKVVKVSSNGWMSAAITEAGDAFVWGMPDQGDGLERLAPVIKDIAEAEGLVGKIRLPSIPKTQVNGDFDFDEVDVIEVAVGDGHLLALDSGQTVWAVGNNREGQLGLGSNNSSTFESEWCKVEDLRAFSDKGQEIRSIHCAPLASFVIAAQTQTC